MANGFQQAYSTAVGAAPTGAHQAATPATGPASGAAKWLVPAALAGTGLYAMYRGSQAADEQEARMMDLSNGRQQDMGSTFPSMAVKQSHDEFTSQALMKLGNGAPLQAPQMPTYHNAAANALASTAVDFGVKQPLSALQSFVKKKLYTEPRQRRVLNEVLAQDPELAQHQAENPEVMHRAYSTLKAFGPSLAMDHNAVRNFLQNSMAVNGNIDYSTIGTLADTEKKIRAARGEIGASL